ncbi:hypothetical protein CPSG_01766, partial [Coccidioides posadasii str. Silveira]
SMVSGESSCTARTFNLSFLTEEWPTLGRQKDDRMASVLLAVYHLGDHLPPPLEVSLSSPPYRPIKRMFTFRTSFPNSVPRWSCEEAKTEDMCQQWTIEIPETVTKHMQAPLHWMKEVGQTESSMHLVVLLQTTPFPPE